MRRLLPLLAVLTAFGALAPAAAPADPRPAAPAPVHATLAPGGQVALFGRSRYGSRYGYGRRSPYRGHPRSRYGYGRRGHGFLHGLFWGWVLGHFLGVGIPIFPLLIVILVVAMLVRRRPRRYEPGMRW